jgi:DNA-binding helix-hairpin-helix protein with protein kinase domain
MELRNENGQPFRLVKPLTRSGGEGQVYELAGTTAVVAKVYHHPPDSKKAAKLLHQVQMPRTGLQAIAAWPTGLLYHPHHPNVIRGILMPRVAGKEIHKLYGPSDRASEFPQASWNFLIHVAMNCAAAFETLHEHGVTMADVNEGNLLIQESDGRVALVDCDSYQIRNSAGTFPCNVGIPMWTPPELQGRDFRGLERTPNHDRFGLAVIVFRLLFMGRHPFAGIPTGPDQFEIADAIRKSLFAFSPQVWSLGVSQPPHSLSLTALPDRIRRLFDRAFLADSAKPNARPTGREWALELKALISSLKKSCLDPGHQHWNGLSTCPWCTIVNSGGPNFFVSVAIHVSSADWTAEFNRLWAVIDRVASGSLMREHATAVLQGPVSGRPMPVSKPTVPRIAPPASPIKSTLKASRIIPAPQYPLPPALRPPAALPAIPLGHNEKMAQLAAIGSALFGLFVIFSHIMGLQIATFGAIWASGLCLFYCAVKWRRARHEASLRQALEAEARLAERMRAEEDHAREMVAHEALVTEIKRQYELESARAEADYQREWQRLDQVYQLQLNSYLSEKRSYDTEQQRYRDALQQWDAEVNRRMAAEIQCRLELNTALDGLKSILTPFQEKVKASLPALDSARKRFEDSRAAELADLRLLNSRRQELQLRHFLSQRLIRDADIPGVGKGRKGTLAAYNVSSAADIHDNLQVPGIGLVLLGKLRAWRRLCESQFNYRAGAPLPVAEVNAVKLKHAQPRQSALAELRIGAAQLEGVEGSTRLAFTAAKQELQNRARAHSQALADLAACS